MDLVKFANKVRPLLEELEGEPPERLASLITAAVIANPMASDDLIAAFEVSRKVLMEFAEESMEQAQEGGG